MKAKSDFLVLAQEAYAGGDMQRALPVKPEGPSTAKLHSTEVTDS